MHNASISVCYKIVKNYKKKIANTYPENIWKYFAKKKKIAFWIQFSIRIKLTLLTIDAERNPLIIVKTILKL